MGFVIEVLTRNTQVLRISIHWCCQVAAVLLQIIDTPPQITAHVIFFRMYLQLGPSVVVVLQFLLNSENNVTSFFKSRIGSCRLATFKINA
jgi:hypothetical protein